MIVCCEEADMDVMDGVRIPLERSAALMKWKMIGEVLVPGVLNAGDIAKTTQGHSWLLWPPKQPLQPWMFMPSRKNSVTVWPAFSAPSVLLRGNGRASALLMAAEGHGFEDVVLYYDHLMEHLRWNNLGHVLAGGNMDVGDIQGKSELEEAYQLGKSIQ